MQCCDLFGLIFPDGQRCFRHQSPADRAWVADLNQRAQTVGIIPDSSRGWPYGPNLYVKGRSDLIEWATRYGLRLSFTHKDGNDSLHWLRRGAGSVSYDSHIDDTTWQDHVTHWTYNRQPACVLSQPYHLSPGALARLAHLESDPSLKVSVGGPLWYGQHTGLQTMSIAIWRHDILDRIYSERLPGSVTF